MCGRVPDPLPLTPGSRTRLHTLSPTPRLSVREIMFGAVGYRTFTARCLSRVRPALARSGRLGFGLTK